LIITIDGVRVEGSKEEIAAKLRNKPYRFTMAKIGELLGCSRQNVSLILKGKSPKLEYPELDNEESYKLSDQELAEKLGLSIYRVASHRRKLGVKKEQPIDIEKRHFYLVKSIYGDDYKPGENIVSLIEKIIKQLHGEARKKFKSFYLDGNKDNNSSRSYRSKIKKKIIKENFDVETAISEKYIEGIE
jgi:biotin operon repressor